MIIVSVTNKDNMKPCFLINARNKEKYVYKSVRGALGQVVPCEILLSDQQSTDGTVAEMRRAVAECSMGADHEIRFVTCPTAGPYSMKAANEHMAWASRQTDAEWIFQSSADDYSLPARVSVCMEAVAKNPCSAVATTMYFEEPDKPSRDTVSGYPKQTGYVKAADGLTNLAYGSTIAGYHRSFLEKVSDKAERVTPDVFFGWLASLDQGFYAIANPQHVHVNHSSMDNTGFQGKMRAAKGEDALRVAELNHMQLADLYMGCLSNAQELYPKKMTFDDMNAIVNMILGQTAGWINARQALHDAGVTPGVI